MMKDEWTDGRMNQRMEDTKPESRRMANTHGYKEEDEMNIRTAKPNSVVWYPREEEDIVERTGFWHQGRQRMPS